MTLQNIRLISSSLLPESTLSQLLGKTQIPRRIDKTLGKSLYRGDNPHLTVGLSRFCKDELGPKFQKQLPIQTLNKRVLSIIYYILKMQIININRIIIIITIIQIIPIKFCQHDPIIITQIDIMIIFAKITSKYNTVFNQV